jgi:hypothetical protein
MPEVATHRYDPAIGPLLNICALEDGEAMRVLERLRRKPDYLGDSMRVAERRVYKLDEIGAHLRDGFGFSDRHGFQPRFIELQLWRNGGIHEA